MSCLHCEYEIPSVDISSNTNESNTRIRISTKFNIVGDNYKSQGQLCQKIVKSLVRHTNNLLSPYIVLTLDSVSCYDLDPSVKNNIVRPMYSIANNFPDDSTSRQNTSSLNIFISDDKIIRPIYFTSQTEKCNGILINYHDFLTFTPELVFVLSSGIAHAMIHYFGVPLGAKSIQNMATVISQNYTSIVSEVFDVTTEYIYPVDYYTGENEPRSPEPTVSSTEMFNTNSKILPYDSEDILELLRLIICYKTIKCSSKYGKNDENIKVIYDCVQNILNTQ